jgi:hypothetical protein
MRVMSPQLQSMSLKSMDSSALTMAVLDAARRAAPAGFTRIYDALSVAAFLHRNQTRANRKDLPRTPYIEHPLRAGLRLLRWGVTDADVIVAALLHDTLEDCDEDIVRYYLELDPTDLTDGEIRRHAIDWMESTFGAEPTGSSSLSPTLPSPRMPPGSRRTPPMPGTSAPPSPASPRYSS